MKSTQAPSEDAQPKPQKPFAAGSSPPASQPGAPKTGLENREEQKSAQRVCESSVHVRVHVSVSVHRDVSAPQGLSRSPAPSPGCSGLLRAGGNTPGSGL